MNEEGDVQNLNSICMALVTILFASSCAVQQPRFQATPGSSREALARGEIKEFLTAMETEALVAETNAATAWFPQQYLKAAQSAYGYAALAAAGLGGHPKPAIKGHFKTGQR